MKKILQICLCSFMLWGCVQNQEHNTITIAIAASLEKAFEKEIIPSFEKNIHIYKFKVFMMGVANYKCKLKKG